MQRTLGNTFTQYFASPGMRTFVVVWFGQFVSVLGSSMSGFALGVWVYQRTGSVTQFALITLCLVVPRIMLSPVAGALIDRWDRRWAMILSDAGSCVGTLFVAILLFSGRLDVWHIYIATAFNAVFSTFQGPAYSATIALLVPKQHLGRANGMVQFSQSSSGIVAPLLGGVLVVYVGLANILLFDFLTFAVALSTLLRVRFPRPLRSPSDIPARQSLLGEIGVGWSYIARRPGLLGLMAIEASNNFLGGLLEVLITPLTLSFTSADQLGLVVSATGGGLLLGGLLMSLWGGPKRRIHGVIGFELLAAALMVLIGFRTSAAVIALFVFGHFVCIAISDGSGQAIWQSKIPPDIQGRVFSLQRMVSWLFLPLGLVLAGPLADNVFEPLIAPTGPLSSNVGQVIGVGSGRGIALLLLIAGVCNILTLCTAYLIPAVRCVEERLPDVALETA